MCVVTGHAVPEILLSLLQGKAAVKEWLTTRLGVVDMEKNAPTIAQPASSPITADLAMSQYLGDGFNNADNCDAYVVIGGKHIHFSRYRVAEVSSKLASQQGCQFVHHAVQLDMHANCDSCKVKLSYPTAIMALQHCYTDNLIWPYGQPDVVTAKELLVLACSNDIPYFLAVAESVLGGFVDRANCCEMLALADCHQAHQLKRYCLHFVAQGLAFVLSEFTLLNARVQAEVRHYAEGLS